MNKKITWSLAILVVLILVGVGFISNSGMFNNSTILQAIAQQPGSDIFQDVVIREERVYVCGDVQEVARRTAGSLNIKTEQGLNNHYATKGYSVVRLKNDFLAQTKVNDFCNYHSSFRHFGIQNNKLAIFQGPLGYNQKLIFIEENIDINTLQPTFQVKLQQAMDFFQMNPETQAKLRYELEFSSEDGLNAALENLDELQE